MIGIYKITNPKNKIYIGKSKNIETRFKSYGKLQHCYQQIKLYNSLKKYGPENHKFEIIEECFMEQLNEREIYWINMFNSIKIGLNLTEGGDGGKLSPSSEEKRRLKSMKPILQYDLDGNFLKEFKGAPDAIKFLEKGNSNNINDCARGKYLTTYGFIWLYKKGKIENTIIPKLSKQGNINPWDEKRRLKIKQSRLGEKRTEEYKQKISNIKKTPIYQYNEQNILTNIFPSFGSLSGSKIIGTTKLRKILNKDVYYKGYKYINIKIND
jgi:group I intron endonuclease